MIHQPMNNWILSKIQTFLTAKEGFRLNKEASVPDYQQIEVTDAFGFKYEITVKTVGRNRHEEDVDVYQKLG